MLYVSEGFAPNSGYLTQGNISIIPNVPPPLNNDD